MRCSEFRSHYSAFRDGLVTDQDLLSRLHVHLAECQACGRHHRSVTLGVDLLKDAIEIEPSPGFEHRLRGRLASLTRDGAPVLPAPAGVAAALMFAAGLTLVAYEAMSRHSPAERSAAQPTTPAVALHHSTPVRRAPLPPASMPYAASADASPDPDLTLTAFRPGGPPAPPSAVADAPVDMLVSLGR